MADQSMQGTAGAGPTFGTAANWAGAVVSLALLAGVGVWGYQLVMRDVSGVPVVKAIEGPMRVAPDNPGGVIAAHQGLSVNQVAGSGEAQPASDTLLLAPNSVAITEDDTPTGVVPIQTGLTSSRVGREEIDVATPIPLKPTPAPAPAPVEVVVETPTPKPAPAPTGTAPNATILALADQIAGDVAPLSTTGPADTPPVKITVAGQEVQSTDNATPVQVASVSTKGAVTRSLRPQVRPARAPSAVTQVVAAVAATAAKPVGEVDPARIPAGTRLVQLGAFDSPEIARSEWNRLSARFDDYLDGKKQVIQRAKSGGRVFYRLRAMGFADLSDARRFCSALAAQNADCIPVVTR